MSKSKQRARAAREAQQQAAARARAAQRKSRGPESERPAARTAGRSSRPGKQPVYRQRRFPKLPWQLKLGLLLGWIAVQVVVFFTVNSVGTRIALAIISLFAVPLLVVLVRDPSRRPPR